MDVIEHGTRPPEQWPGAGEPPESWPPLSSTLHMRPWVRLSATWP